MRKPISKATSLAALVALGLALAVQAAEPRKGNSAGGASTVASQDRTWVLSTEDTEMKLSVEGNRVVVKGLSNPARKWQWVPAASEVPLPGKGNVKVGEAALTPDWVFRDAMETKTNGHAVVLRFTSATPALELKSHWQALPGGGPVENWMTIENKSEGVVTLTPVPAGALQFKADRVMQLHRAHKTPKGKGQVFIDPIAANDTYSTDRDIIPFVIFDAGSEHGLYLGLEWELGGFQAGAGADPLSVSASAHPLTEDIAIAAGEAIWIPAVYYGVYKGDPDDGANRFKRWFWNHKITRSLHDNPDEPWVEVCMEEIGGKGYASSTGLTSQRLYDRLADAGAECAKMDYWDGTGGCWYTGQDWMYKPAVWPNGFDFAAKAHKAGMKASLYMGGTYMDCDLNTIAGRDLQLAALLKRYDEGWFDMWRTDKWVARYEPMPSTYRGIMNFHYIIDHLIANRPGFRYENCSNGGRFKGLNICRRMTFCTMNGADKTPWEIRTTYYSHSFAINTVQLKSDLGPAQTPYHLRTHMLGAILSWAVDNPVYRQHIALYKARQRPILRGANVYHILPIPNNKDWDGLQFHNPDLDRGSVFLFKPSAEAPETQVVKLKGLIRDRNYDVAFQDATERSCAMTGARLMDEGLAVTLTGKEASEIVWINCPELSCSTNALSFTVETPAAGVSPAPVAIAYRKGPGANNPFTVAGAAPWVKIARGTGSGHGQTFSVSVVPGDMPAGLYRSKVVVSRHDIPDRVEVPVSMQLGKPVPLSVRWKLDEKDGNTARDEWGDKTGTLVGGPVWGAGKRGGALYFNGRGQYMDAKWSLDGLQWPCTFAFWVKPGATQVDNAAIFGNNGSPPRRAQPVTGIVMQQDGANLNQYVFGDGSEALPTDCGPVELMADEWQHVAVVCDGKEVVIYHDGNESVRGKARNPLTPNPLMSFRLGNGHAEGRFFNGALDDFRIYGRALTAAEVAALAKETDKMDVKENRK